MGNNNSCVHDIGIIINFFMKEEQEIMYYNREGCCK